MKWREGAPVTVPTTPPVTPPAPAPPRRAGPGRGLCPLGSWPLHLQVCPSVLTSGVGDFLFDCGADSILSLPVPL